MKKIIKLLAFCVMACTLALGASADANSDEIYVPTVAGDDTGVWLESFVTATNRSIRENIPLILLWGNEKCSECNLLEKEVQTASFLAWQREQPYLFCAIEGVNGKDAGVNAGTGARDFAKTAGGKRKELKSGFPYVCLYWPKADGTVTAYSFTGRTGMMFSPNGKTLVAQFKASIEECFAGYQPIPQADVFSFVVGDTTYDRLEAEPDTAYVDVPVTRDIKKGGSATTRLVSIWPDGLRTPVTNEIAWAATETLKYVRVSLDRGGAAFPVGKAITLFLSDVEGSTVGEGAIHFVAKQANSLCNPAWLEEEFAAGEWTMDMDKALEKAQNGEFERILLYFSGVLWCPHCQGLEDDLFNSDEFRAWCVSNKVGLVLMDNPRRVPASSGDDYTIRTVMGPPPTLLRYAAGNNNYKQSMMSGASYLSRKSIPVGSASTSGTAEFVLQRNRNLGYEWGVGTYCAPGAGRAGYPTVILLRKDGSIVGRFNRCERNESASGGNAYAHPKAENMARLNDLLLLEAGDGESSNYPSTTTLTHTIGGKSVSRLQINDNVDFYLLSGVQAGDISFTSSAAKPVLLSLQQNGDLLASGTNSVSFKLKKDTVSAGKIYLKVQAYPDRSLLVGANTGFEATVLSSLDPAVIIDEANCYIYLDTSIVLQEIEADAGAKVVIKRTSGQLPFGMRLVYNEDNRTVVLTGTPKRASDSVFAYTVSINGVVSDPEEVRISMLSTVGVNDYLMTKITRNLPLYDRTCEVGVLAGELKISQSSKNSLMVKYMGTGRKTLSFKGAWQSLDSSGTAFANLSTSTGQRLALSMDTAGLISATLSGLGAEHSVFGTASLSGTALVASGFSPYSGYYTVTFPNADENPTTNPVGTAYVLVTVPESSASNGKAKFTGMLPNGTKISGSGNLILDANEEGYAILPIIKRSSSDVFSVALRIKANGRSLYTDSNTVRIVLAEDGTSAYWAHFDQGKGIENFLNTWGGWFNKNLTLKEWMSMFSMGDVLEFAVDTSLFMPGDGGEDLLQATTATLAVDDRKSFVAIEVLGEPFKISYARGTGVIRGKATLTFSNGKSVLAAYEGVLLPGWIDCQCYEESLQERPFASGSVIFKDLVNGVRVKRSLPFNIDVPLVVE